MKNFTNWLAKRDKNLFEAISQNEYGNDNTQNKKELVVLIGPPAIGKSTFIAKKFKPDDVFIVSRDNLVDEVSNKYGLTYDDMFVLPPSNAKLNSLIDGMEKYGIVQKAPPWMKWTPVVYERVQNANSEINKLLEQRFKDSVTSGKNIVVDMTNMNTNSRRNALKHAHGLDYYRRAVVFTMQDSDLPELLRRMKTRSEKIKQQGGSKTIGEDVINKMIANFEKVSPEEGFDKIDTINTFSV